MKKKRVNEILLDQVKRKRIIMVYSMEISLYVFLTISFFLLFIFSNRKEYINYEEQSNINYKVYYEDNEYFKEPLNNQDYIASLIKNIKADFTYKLKVLDKSVSYQYSYAIKANLEIRSKESNNILYEITDTLVPESIVEVNANSEDILVTRAVDIDYNYYNNLVNKFVRTYELEDVVATLNINMNTKVIGDCEEFSGVKEGTSSLNIPLSKKTMGIDLTYDLLDSKDQKFLKCKKVNGFNYYYIICSMVMFLVSLYFIWKLYKYLKKTLKAEDVYERELKKILNNYKSYIEKINSPFNLKNYTNLKVDTFNDLLEIRETIMAPILMFENATKGEVLFMIPSGKICYTYTLKIKDIRKKLLNAYEEEN